MLRFSKIGMVSTALAVLVSLSACNTNQPAKAQMSDATITAKVKSKFAGDPEVRAMNIDVDTQDGIVYLIGRVKDQSERAEAEKIARDTHGVVDVKNMLEIVGH